jgi:hypothetical protein
VTGSTSITCERKSGTLSFDFDNEQQRVAINLLSADIRANDNLYLRDARCSLI